MFKTIIAAIILVTSTVSVYATTIECVRTDASRQYQVQAQQRAYCSSQFNGHTYRGSMTGIVTTNCNSYTTLNDELSAAFVNELFKDRNSPFILISTDIVNGNQIRGLEVFTAHNPAGYYINWSQVSFDNTKSSFMIGQNKITYFKKSGVLKVEKQGLATLFGTNATYRCYN